MKNLEKFSAKVQYVTPSCKSVRIQARQTILTGSYGEEGRAGGRGYLYDNSEEEDY